MEDVREIPSVMKQSHTKIWIRTGILAVFWTIFGQTIYHDIISGIFFWSWAVIPFLACLVSGFWMSRLVPMQVYAEFQLITLSFDRVYFLLIFFLVAIKTVAVEVFGLTVLADVIMSAILGMMIGRLSGICLRVRALKNNFNEQSVSR